MSATFRRSSDSSVQSTSIGSIETQTARRRKAWLDTVAQLGAKGQ
jgi:hypothetical protein